MKPRYKVTGCARFFVFLIIFLPIVFFGAAYLRGENGMQIIKDFWSKLTGKEKTEITIQKGDDQSDRVRELEMELKEAKEKIKELEEKLKEK